MLREHPAHLPVLAELLYGIYSILCSSCVLFQLLLQREYGGVDILEGRQADVVAAVVLEEAVEVAASMEEEGEG